MIDHNDPSLAETLTKLVRRFASDEQAFPLFLAKLHTHGISVHDLRIEIGNVDEIDRLRRRINELEMVAPRSWQDFEDLAMAKGYETLKSMGDVIGKDSTFVKQCKNQGLIAFACHYRMAQAPDLTQQKATFPNKMASRYNKAAKNNLGRSASNFTEYNTRYPEAYEQFRATALEEIRTGKKRGIARDILRSIRVAGKKVPQELSGQFAERFRQDSPEHAIFFIRRASTNRSLGDSPFHQKDIGDSVSPIA